MTRLSSITLFTLLYNGYNLLHMNKNLRYLLYILLGVIIGLVVKEVDFSSFKRQLPLSCTYKGQTYKSGESFKDDCNTCTCQGGEVECTLMGCMP